MVLQQLTPEQIQQQVAGNKPQLAPQGVSEQERIVDANKAKQGFMNAKNNGFKGTADGYMDMLQKEGYVVQGFNEYKKQKAQKQYQDNPGWFDRLGMGIANTYLATTGSKNRYDTSKPLEGQFGAESYWSFASDKMGAMPDVVAGPMQAVISAPLDIVGSIVGLVNPETGEKIQQLTDIEPFLEKNGLADTFFFDASKFATDLGMSLAGAKALLGQIKNIPQLQAFSQAFPTASKYIGLAGKGAVEGALFSAGFEGEFDPSQVIAGAVLEPLFPVAGKVVKALGKGLKNIPAKAQLSGLLNPAKLDYLKNQLVVEGIEGVSAEADDVAEWMFQRGIKGDKQSIIKQLKAIGDESKKTVDQVLASSKTKYSYNTATRVIDDMIEDVKDIPGLEKEVDELLALRAGDNMYSLSALNEVKRNMDSIYNIYKTSGEAKAGLKAKGLNNLRVEIRKAIEDLSQREGLAQGFDGNAIKLLNNQTSTAYGLAEAIARKESSDFARELLQAVGGRATGGIAGGFAGLQVGGPFNSNTTEGKIGNMLVGAFLGSLAGSTKVKTNVANILAKLGSKQKSEIYEWMISGGAKKLTPKAQKGINTIVDGMNEARLFDTDFYKNLENMGTPNKMTTSTNNPMTPRGIPNVISNELLIKKANESESVVEYLDRLRKEGIDINPSNRDSIVKVFDDIATKKTFDKIPDNVDITDYSSWGERELEEELARKGIKGDFSDAGTREMIEALEKGGSKLDNVSDDLLQEAN